MTRAAKLGMAGTVSVVLLGAASYFTTTGHVDGGFPSGEFRIGVVDASGKPVKGATLRVYRGGSRDLAFDYPLDNHVTGRELVSDERGRITGIRKRGGLQFGGRVWSLFWLIPIEPSPPRYDCELSVSGFKTHKFDVNRLFESPHKFYEDFPKTKLRVDGEDIELKVYDHSFTLER